MENAMHKIILLGAISFVLAFGAVSANAMPAPSGTWPHAAMNQSSPPSTLADGRAAYVGGNTRRSTSAMCR
jgi:hypothetical protein